MSEVTLAQAGCLCGAVRLSTPSRSNGIGACHCGICRKWGGAALLAVDCGADVSFVGADQISVYQSSDWAERGFCQRCGTHLFYRLKQNGQYYIPAGLFDSDQGLVFEHQVFIDAKPDYYAFANQTHNLTGAEVFAQFEALEP